ncbi:molybdopterin converting factor subunit 1 [Alkalihalobacillus sp. LMS39]|uniref:molybdopterin converting factor subunit 1 n=1 Tax=Alkalihalobacillus sp. LMS39 TaxID=2924032 RepID=UPI001FB2E2DE|nr:molybdopterin converting factor subunit 1 [Alkalihalobacillus sp. LMS39]UOE92177.1 molybdopterin converting factor subunit 1 [Alkalihalobacillus sp. LMS39]
MIKVLFFAGLAEKTGRYEVEIAGVDLTVNEVIEQITKQFPSIEAELAHSMIAVNEELVERTTIVKENDTVAFIPPVSGG